MSDADEVLEIMKAAGEPLSAGQIAERGGVDRAAVDKAMASSPSPSCWRCGSRAAAFVVL